ncbi:MAG: histidinol dehydrogenase [Tenacibaculum sp.]
MKIVLYPKAKDRQVLYKRASTDSSKVQAKTKSILKEVRQYGDTALKKYTKIFDKVDLACLKVTEKEIQNAKKHIKSPLKNAIKLAKTNIEKFHQSQKETINKITTSPGVKCWRKSVAIEKVGLYIPGGSAPLFSTILMLGIPAKIAGCKKIILCTPPDIQGNIHPAILYTASLLGLKEIYKLGGVQAIGALAYGTESIPKVYKILGPGNKFVTKAKEMVQQQGIAIDMPAGPSEVIVIADASAEPAFVAADLLSQAEHGPDSQAILVSNCKETSLKVIKELNLQLANISRREIAKKAIENSFAIVLNSIEACINFSNQYAPEHLIIASDKALNFSKKITNAGSVFLGNYSCESLGDYATGTNHTLPTNGYAKNYSGVSLDSFVKKISFQQVSQKGIQQIGKAVEIMADAEGLQGHKNAVSIRLNKL